MVCRGLGGSEGCGGVGGVGVGMGGVGLWHELARFNNLYCMYKYHKAFPNCPYFFFNLATWEYFNNCSIWWRFRKRSTYLSDAYASDGGWGIKKFFKKNYDNSVFKQWNARAGKKKKKILSCDAVKGNATTLSKGNRRDWRTQFGKHPYAAYFHSCFQEVFVWRWKKRCLDCFTPLGQIRFFFFLSTHKEEQGSSFCLLKVGGGVGFHSFSGPRASWLILRWGM